MSQIAVGVFKQVNFKRQTGLGTIASGGAATGQSLRRTKSTLDLTKQTFKSNEILLSQQRRDMRHGVRAITGTISGELSVGTYQAFFESLMRQVVQSQITSGALTTIAAAVTSGASGTFTRSAGSWITDGYKLGMIVTSIGWATTGIPNNSHYLVITALTATVMTGYMIDGVAFGAKAAGDSVTVSQVGKSTWLPSSGQVRHYYTIEHFFSDIAQDELYTDCVISEAQLKMPANGMSTVDFPIMGLGYGENTTAYFTSPTGPTTSGIEASPNGVILVNNIPIGVVTSFDLTIKGNYSAPGGIVGSVNDPDIFPGSVDVTGTMSVLFQDATIVDLFVNETEFAVVLAMTSTANGVSSSGPNFTAFNMQRVKATGATKDDGEKGITLTFPFTALEYTAGATNLRPTTLEIQDSLFA